MTTSDLIAEALIRFREEIMAEVHAEIKKARYLIEYRLALIFKQTSFTGEDCDYCENTGKVEVNNPKSQGEAIIPCPKCKANRKHKPDCRRGAAQGVKCGVPETPKNKIEIKCAPNCVACARNREIMQDKFPRHTLD